MISEVSIRVAAPADLAVLQRFQQGVVDAERPYDPTLREGPLQYYDLTELMANAQTRLLVATVGAEVVASGYARLEPAEPYLKHRTYAHLGFMYVDPAYRGRGINGQLVEALRQWTRAQGVTEMRLEVYADNAAARRAYEKVGFTRHMLEMRMPV